MFVEFEQAATKGVEKFGWEPIKLATNADMLAVWKSNQVGGAMKRDEHPCHCCNMKNEEITIPNSDKDQCRWCTLLGYQGDETKKCYHYQMLTGKAVKSMEDDLQGLEDVFQGMLDKLIAIREQSHLNCNENPRIRVNKASKNDVNSIHFSIKNRTEQVIAEYNAIIAHDLEIRGMDSVTGSLKKRQGRLKKRL
ncbi:hypothetical protein ACA910_015253 [Epithemia clementina (nom. ined.)]